MFIYIITNLVNGKKYVGQTITSLRKRWAVHTAFVKRGSRFYLHNAIRKYGEESFEIRPVFSVRTKMSANRLEKALIKMLDLRNPKKGYNLTDGGEGAVGRIVSPSARKAIGKFNSGKTLSKETRKKISESRKGIPAWNKGKEPTEEHRRKMRLAKVGARLSEKHKRNIGRSLRKFYKQQKQKEN